VNLACECIFSFLQTFLSRQRIKTLFFIWILPSLILFAFKMFWYFLALRNLSVFVCLDRLQCLNFLLVIFFTSKTICFFCFTIHPDLFCCLHWLKISFHHHFSTVANGNCVKSFKMMFWLKMVDEKRWEVRKIKTKNCPIILPLN